MRMIKTLRMATLLFFAMPLYGNAEKISQARGAADARMEELRLSLGEYKVSETENGYPWPKTYVEMFEKSRDKGHEALKNALQDKKFTAIYYQPKNAKKRGGDVTIFVEQATNRILGMLRGR